MKASWRWREYCPEIVSFMVQLTEKGGRRCVKCWKKRDERIYMQFKNQHEEKDAEIAALKAQLATLGGKSRI